jgi:peroxiredoxin (alkyl hydroperoxide reductase subunit C)
MDRHRLREGRAEDDLEHGLQGSGTSSTGIRSISRSCATEIKGFQALQGDFGDDKVEVIGVSTDSFFSHKAWFADRKTFPQEITHPVIADTNHVVSKAFHVLKEDQGIAFRATVVVDDKGIVRTVAVNDLSAGRSPSETLRTVQALQSGGLCGADWKKGDSFAG